MAGTSGEATSGSPRRALILTALSVEFKAVQAHLHDVREDEDAVGTVYEVGRFGSGKSAWDVCIAQVGVGNPEAAAAVERALAYFPPQVALFVGVAGGIKDVAVGDVVAATRVYGYESGKETDEGFLPRPDVVRSSFRLVERAKAEARGTGWQARVPGQKLSGTPTALVAPLAAGEKVVASTRSATCKFISRQYGDAVAVEMEGGGFLEALYAHKDVDGLVVRGISDLLTGKSEADAEGSQEVASRHAAAFAFQVLARMRMEGRARPGRQAEVQAKADGGADPTTVQADGGRDEIHVVDAGKTPEEIGWFQYDETDHTSIGIDTSLGYPVVRVSRPDEAYRLPAVEDNSRESLLTRRRFLWAEIGPSDEGIVYVRTLLADNKYRHLVYSRTHAHPFKDDRWRREYYLPMPDALHLHLPGSGPRWGVLLPVGDDFRRYWNEPYQGVLGIHLSQIISLGSVYGISDESWALSRSLPEGEPAPGLSPDRSSGSRGDAQAPPVPEYVVVDEEVHDAPVKTRVILHVVVSGWVEESGFRVLLDKLYEEVMRRGGFKFHSSPTAAFIYVYTSREHARTGMGQWVAMLAKAHADPAPAVTIDMERYARIVAPEEDRFGLSETTRKTVWGEIVQAENRAATEAQRAHPEPHPTSPGYSQDEAVQAFQKAAGLEQELVKKHEQALAREYRLTEEQLSQIRVEGLEKHWPLLKETMKGERPTHFYMTIPPKFLPRLGLGELREGVVVSLPADETPGNWASFDGELVFADPLTGQEVRVSSRQTNFHWTSRRPAESEPVPAVLRLRDDKVRGA